MRVGEGRGRLRYVQGLRASPDSPDRESQISIQAQRLGLVRGRRAGPTAAGAGADPKCTRCSSDNGDPGGGVLVLLVVLARYGDGGCTRMAVWTGDARCVVCMRDVVV